jgi:ABC-type multidrug transport system ATPase subunit
LLKDKTRILVTHAVDFVHLADRVIIMENGGIQAQGTPEELANNEYMLQILDIHKKHKKENEQAANDANEKEEIDA